ncbi:MAG: hypothetical protein L6R40_007281 [Gallowayella cf. fulva]|nr:MAG: hypothetical protein L6R40_007281 [Xanthomendoza cf. fulva]
MSFQRVLASLLYTSALLSTSNAAAARSSQHELPSLRELTNFSVPGALASHPHFSLDVHVTEDTQLNPIAMLMNAVDLLAVTGLKDYQGHSAATLFHSPDHPDVVIALVPTGPATEVLNEVVSLCAYYGMEDMIRYRQYKECTFTCAWDNVDVAVLNIWDQSSAVKHTGAFINSLRNETTDLTNSPLKAVQPQFAYLNRAERLDMRLAFVTIMHAIMSSSRFSGTDIVSPSFTDPSHEWDASVVFPSDGPERTEPPFFEYRYVIQTLRQAPRYMLRHKWFAQLAMLVHVDGHYLGNALLMKGKPPQPTARSRAPVVFA